MDQFSNCLGLILKVQPVSSPGVSWDSDEYPGTIRSVKKFHPGISEPQVLELIRKTESLLYFGEVKCSGLEDIFLFSSHDSGRLEQPREAPAWEHHRVQVSSSQR